MKKVYRFYSDPGHGWLRVDFIELIHLNIYSRISTCSYRKGKYVYLEEDRDAGIFIEAKKASGQQVKINFLKQAEVYSNIRRYPSYSVSEN